MSPRQFRTTVLTYYRTHGRHDLPWRTTTNPYRILVSEVMLQQTQVARVIPYYHSFLKQFPTVRALANAPLSEVLTLWQGLGYNRRAKMLHEAAKAIGRQRFPTDQKALEALPGIGPYTAAAVAAFSTNTDVLCIETNIRTAVLHHFFPNKRNVPDAEIMNILEEAYPRGRAREWYSALMDYGSFLKQSGVRTNTQAKGYAPQKKFIGSDREARGAILKSLTSGAKTKRTLSLLLGATRSSQLNTQLAALIKEGFVEGTGARYHLPS